MFDGIIEFVVLKRKALQEMVTDLKVQQSLLDELKTCKNPQRISEIMNEIEAMNHSEKEYIAFKDKTTGEVQWDKWVASTYHDELTSSDSSTFRYWFICKAGGQWPCNSLILSKKWGRKFEDPSASKNKYRCTVCGANYKTIWGVLIEVTETDQYGRPTALYYMTAEPPNEDVLDVKAAQIEATLAKRARTAREVYDAIPSFAPSVSSVVSVVDEQAGQYKVIDDAFLKTLPVWRWADIFTLGMSMAEGQTFAQACGAARPKDELEHV
jgi:hypothetical protein